MAEYLLAFSGSFILKRKNAFYLVERGNFFKVTRSKAIIETERLNNAFFIFHVGTISLIFLIENGALTLKKKEL